VTTPLARSGARRITALADRHREHAGALRVRDRRRPDRSEPRVDLVLGLRRVHTGHASACRGGALQREESHGDVHRRSYDIGDQPVTGLALNESNGDLYASTDFGVLRLPNGSTGWIQAATGLPQVAVYGLTLAQGAHVLYAATHGRGAYTLSLP
jgi:hypothetical protein